MQEKIHCLVRWLVLGLDQGFLCGAKIEGGQGGESPPSEIFSESPPPRSPYIFKKSFQQN